MDIKSSIKKLYSNTTKDTKKSKAKTPEPCRSGPHAFMNSYHHQTSPNYAYSHPTHHIQSPTCHQYQPPQVYQPQNMPMHMPISPPCLHQFTQQHIVQSSPQSVSYQLQSPMRNGYDSRPNDHQGMVLGNHAQIPQLQPCQIAMPVALPANQAAQPIMENQTSRFTDNPCYSNQIETFVAHQNQYPQQFPTNNQLQPANQQQRVIQDEQRSSQRQQVQQQQQQIPQQLCQQTTQNDLIHHQNHHDNNHYFNHNNQQQQYQQYQNANQIVNESVNGGLMNVADVKYSNGQSLNGQAENGNEDFSIEVLLLMHERDKAELSKMSEYLKGDLMKLASDLDKIKKETPKYSVREVRI